MANLLSTTINGTGTATSDFRAPIFYDSANTGYYLDLNGTSYLYHLILSGNAYFRPSSWIQLDGNYGLYWPNHYGLHVYPNNDGSYGSLQVKGSKNSWHGIHFDSGNTLMSNANEAGFHQQGVGWKFRWYAGEMYISPNSTGGGTERTVLHSGNFSTWAASASHTHSYLPLSGGSLTGNLTSSASLDFSGSAYFGSGISTAGSIECSYISDSGGAYIGGDITCGSNITATGEITAYSDERLKESITTIDNAVALVKQLRGVRYVMKETQKQSVGVIAQETIKALPEVVSESQEGMLSVAYGNIVSVLIEAVKEQQIQIDELKKVIEEKCQ